jgi:hypothetical protein
VTRHDVRPGAGELLEQGHRPFDHQVAVQGEGRHSPNTLDDDRPHRQDGHEVRIHRIDVDELDVRLHQLDLLGQEGVVGREDRRGQLRLHEGGFYPRSPGRPDSPSALRKPA